MSTTSITPYAAAKVVNATLKAAGIDKQIPPQMMYNYTTARVRAGKTPFIEMDEEGKITEAGLTKWLEKYIAKKVAVTTN